MSMWLKMTKCECCIHFQEYEKEYDWEYEVNKSMSDGLCKDPDPIDDNIPRFKSDWCKHFERK